MRAVLVSRGILIIILSTGNKQMSLFVSSQADGSEPLITEE